ncbi:hypothetical protein MESS4_170002 [Mesorhizobium sp. STM 4661]|nr:hypothetical protein MESS4_170002 [Mesorhizobium sp. STM 4661]
MALIAKIAVIAKLRLPCKQAGEPDACRGTGFGIWIGQSSPWLALNDLEAAQNVQRPAPPELARQKSQIHPQ